MNLYGCALLLEQVLCISVSQCGWMKGRREG